MRPQAAGDSSSKAGPRTRLAQVRGFWFISPQRQHGLQLGQSRQMKVIGVVGVVACKPFAHDAFARAAFVVHSLHLS